MDVTIKHQPSFALAIIDMGAGEVIQAEPGSMVSHTHGINVETKAKGGIMGGFKRMLAGEDFFQNMYTAPSGGGQMTFAPSLPGDMMVIRVQPGTEFLLQSGAYIVSENGVEMDSKWGGAKGFFGAGGSLIMIKVSGNGQMVIGSYGAIEERTLAAGEKYIVDTGHIVGMEGSVQFAVKKAGSWKSTLLGGEGLVAELTGPGRVLMQTRSESAFLGWLLPKLPKSSN